MASNAELAASIAALSESAATDGLNNAELSALLKKLKAENESEAEAEAKAEADDVPRVAPGKSITSKRGILGPGEEVRESDVNDLSALKKRGIVK